MIWMAYPLFSHNSNEIILVKTTIRLLIAKNELFSSNCFNPFLMVEGDNPKLVLPTYH